MGPKQISEVLHLLLILESKRGIRSGRWRGFVRSGLRRLLFRVRLSRRAEPNGPGGFLGREREAITLRSSTYPPPIYKHTSPRGSTFITQRWEELRKRRVRAVPPPQIKALKVR